MGSIRACLRRPNMDSPRCVFTQWSTSMVRTDSIASRIKGVVRSARKAGIASTSFPTSLSGPRVVRLLYFPKMDSMLSEEASQVWSVGILAASTSTWARKRFADALVETFGFENGLNVLGLGHHLGGCHQVIPILKQPGEALEKAAASTRRVVPEGLVEVVDRELGMGVQGLAKRRFIGVTAADDGAQGLRRCGTAACAQVLPSRPVQDALRLDRAEVTPIMIGEKALCPLHVGIQVHEARLGALARRQQEREVALLPEDDQVARQCARNAFQRASGPSSPLSKVAMRWEIS